MKDTTGRYQQAMLPRGDYPSCPVRYPVKSQDDLDRRCRDLAAGLKEQRECRIREAAYFLAQEWGFEPRHDWEDWFAAELMVDQESRPWPTD